MSEIGIGFGPEGQQPPPPPRRSGAGRRRAVRRRRFRGCLPLLVAILILGVGAWLGGGALVDKVKELAGSAPDYPGPGTGSVTVQVREGDSAAAIGRTLKAEGVVKSVDAFTDAAVADERSRGIQVGYYELKAEMKAADALAVLVDPENLIQARVTIPEGYRIKDIIPAIAKNTDITRAQVRAALAKPASLGLPPESGGEPEGYLFPATYSVAPDETARSLLRQMVAKTKEIEAELDIAAKAAELGFTPQQILTVASILEYEGSRDQDYPKIARAIYNRLEAGMRLQSDATVAYANDLEGTVWTTEEERRNPSPYNTYVHTGLPPGPIGSPGEKTIEAALNPADGPWIYWLVVNLRTGETRFNETYEGHLRDRDELHEYCQTSDAC